MLIARVCIFGMLLGTFATLAFAQTPNSTPQKELIYLRFSIWDEKSKDYLKGLKADQFQIVEDNKRLPIEYFSGQEETGVIGFLVDLSGSMGNDDKNSKFNKIALNVHGFDRLINSINSGNTYFVDGFSDKLVEVVDLTTDLSKVKTGLEELARVRKPKGDTSVFDAVSLALTKLATFKGKRILIVASDGMDNSSRISPKKLKKQLQESGVTVYMIDYSRPDEFVGFLPSGGYLGGLVKESGGSVVLLSKVSEVNDAFELLGSYIRYQYVLGLTPLVQKSEKWHKVKITLNSKDGKEERTIAKTGYYY